MADSSVPPSRGQQMLIVQLVFISVAGACALIRLYSKCVIVKKVKVDDYLIWAATLAYAALAAVNLDGILHGATGRPSELIPGVDEETRSLRSWYLAEVLYPPMTLAIRGSLCVFLLRLATKKVHIRIIWANFAVLAVVSSTFFFILTFQCEPVDYFWTKAYGKPGSCIDKRIIGFSVIVHAVSSALSDWCLGILPVLILWHVNLNKRTKAIIALLLSLGIIAGLVLIIRLTYVNDLEPGPDFLYKSVDIGIWSVMEPAFGIIAACIPTFRPLFKNWGFGWTRSQLGLSRPGSVVYRVSRRYTNRFSFQSPEKEEYTNRFSLEPKDDRCPESSPIFEPVMQEAYVRHSLVDVDEEATITSSDRGSQAYSVDIVPPTVKRNSQRTSAPPPIPYPPGYRPKSFFDQK